MMEYYFCKKCGFNIWAEYDGKDYGMIGFDQYYLCKDCKELVKIGDEENGIIARNCPSCGRSVFLHKWNPVNGPCPKCGNRLELDVSKGICVW